MITQNTSNEGTDNDTSLHRSTDKLTESSHNISSMEFTHLKLNKSTQEDESRSALWTSQNFLAIHDNVARAARASLLEKQRTQES